jgi:hypothetical protein
VTGNSWFEMGRALSLDDDNPCKNKYKEELVTLSNDLSSVTLASLC